MAYIRKRKLKNGHNRYYIEVNIYDSTNGMKAIHRSKVFEPREDIKEEELLKALNEEATIFEAEVKRKYRLGYGCKDVKFNEFLDIYLEHIKLKLGLASFYRYQNETKVIKEYFKNLELYKFNPRNIQAFFDYVDERKKTIITVSPRFDFKKVLRNHDFLKNAYSKQIRDSSLEQALNGKNVSYEWAERYAEKVGLKFNELFIIHKKQEYYAYNTRKRIKAHLRAMLAYAKRMQYIDVNYAQSDFVFYTSNKDKNDIKTLSYEQVCILFNCLEKEEDIRIKTSIMLFLFTGCRRGELAGLKWDDIDLENGFVEIKRSLIQITHHGTIEKEPKTRNSKRIIDIPDVMINQLKKYKIWQLDYQNNLKEKYIDEGWVFTSQIGTHINPDVLNKHLNIILQKANLPHFTIHSLRHTNITLQIEAGVPITTVSLRAGHSRISTTTDIYAYSFRKSNRIAAKSLEMLLMDSKNEKNTSDLTSDFKKLHTKT